MDIKEIEATALRVKNKYRKLEIARMRREWNLSEMTEGLMVDMGMLMKFVMAKEGKRVVDDVDEKLKDELTDCLWAIICIADKLGIDIEADFGDKMKKLEERIDKTLADPTKVD